MRTLLLAALMFAVNTAARADTFVYLSQPKENAIGIYKLADDGSLAKVETYGVSAGAGSLAFHPGSNLLVASLRTATKLASYRVDPYSGKLAPINATPLAEGANAAFVTINRDARFLISASYSGGRVVVHAIDSEGRLSAEPLHVAETAKTAHSAYFDRDEKRVFVPHVAPNAVYQFEFDAATGGLKEFGRAPGGTPAAGPRHLAIHASQQFAFTSDESGSSITLYTLDSAGLKPKQTLSTLPPDFTAKNTTAHVLLHPNGRFVWVSNRGHDSLAGFAFDADKQELTSLGQTPTEKTPRSFDIDPSGRYLFAGGEGSGKLAAYKIDQHTGALERIATYDVGQSISWVMAVNVEAK